MYPLSDLVRTSSNNFDIIRLFKRSLIHWLNMENLVIENQKIENGQVTLKNLPFSNGDEVSIFLWKRPKNKHYPLRGKLIKFINPTEPVSENDWDVLN